MPLYTYECDNCGVQFDKLQKFTDKPIKRCPECNKNSARRVIQPAGIIFKGSGWYKTDSRSSSTSTSTPSKKDKTDTTETKADATTETKTETKSDAKAETKSESKKSKKKSSD